MDERAPDDGQVWLSVEAAALVLGVGRVRVQQLVAEGRLPHVRRGRRIWLRRDHVEQSAAARAFAAVHQGGRDEAPPPPQEGRRGRGRGRRR